MGMYQTPRGRQPGWKRDRDPFDVGSYGVDAARIKACIVEDGRREERATATWSLRGKWGMGFFKGEEVIFALGRDIWEVSVLGVEELAALPPMIASRVQPGSILLWEFVYVEPEKFDGPCRLGKWEPRFRPTLRHIGDERIRRMIVPRGEQGNHHDLNAARERRSREKRSRLEFDFDF